MDVSDAVLAEAARGLRAVLAELDDPASELTTSTVTRRRIEGAALALETAAQEASEDSAR